MPRMGYFLFLWVSQFGRSVRNLWLPGSGRQLMKTSRLAKFESYVAKGAHCANVAQMGIRQSLHLRQEIKILNRPLWAVLILAWRRWRDAPERSAWRIRECAIRKILKNRLGKIFLIFIIVYRGQEFISASIIPLHRRGVFIYKNGEGSATFLQERTSIYNNYAVSISARIKVLGQKASLITYIFLLR